MSPPVRKTALYRNITSLSVHNARLLLWLLLVAAFPRDGIAQSGTFIPTDSLTTARSAYSATRLPDGRVLIAGGEGGGAFGYLSSAETYDPFAGAFSTTGSLNFIYGNHAATLLPTGKVLIEGGGVAELYDPSTGVFTQTGSPQPNNYQEHTATLLPNGKVLIAGGRAWYDPNTPAELYDPSTGSFAQTGYMYQNRYRHAATLLEDGKVLITGGLVHLSVLSTAEIYDPVSGTFSPTGSMKTPRYGHTSTLLPNGKVLIEGGDPCFSNYCAPAPTYDAEIYDPASSTFSAVPGVLPAWSGGRSAVLLPSGKVLIAGGYYGTLAFLYDFRTNSFQPAAFMAKIHGGASGVLLPNGSVLIAGGFDSSNYGNTAELYVPNRPPTANAGADQTVECGSVNGALVTLNGSTSSDPDGDPLTYLWKNSSGQTIGTTAIVNNVVVPLGASTFTLTVTDSHGDSNSDSVTITVRDTTAPRLSVALNPNVLWPPNHKLIPVTASLLFNDTCDASPRLVLLSLTSNEPDDGQGDGDTPNDIQGAALNTDDRVFQLRAERSTKGTGRVYTATYLIRDASGNSRTATGAVLVPLTNSQRQ